MLLASGCGGSGGSSGSDVIDTPAELGEKLFFDTNLSANKTQSCATCHDPERAFTDGRLDAYGQISAVSLGDDGISLGDRNAPTAAYAGFAPDFVAAGNRQRPGRTGSHAQYTGALGGQFLDGRQADLAGQAGGPPLNPIEMGLADRASVVARLQEDEEYLQAFRRLFGDTVFDDVDTAYAAMTQSIAAFENTAQFAPFDSKYDRFLNGTYQLSFKESTGKALFFAGNMNCGICHQLHQLGDPVNKFQETFSGYEYHNIGVPENTEVRALNGVTVADGGLLNNAQITDPAQEGKFKVPTLRNVAVTEPYMHNGVFRDLRTVIEFYDHFVSGSTHMLNPETGIAWAAPEVPANLASSELQDSTALNDFQVESLVCFLRTLTDQRYELLIQDKGIECADP
jgi:cytochrome c peroxidase